MEAARRHAADCWRHQPPKAHLVLLSSRKRAYEPRPCAPSAPSLSCELLISPSLQLPPSASQRKDEEGRLYYTFEFTSATSRAKRHAISTIAITNGAHSHAQPRSRLSDAPHRGPKCTRRGDDRSLVYCAVSSPLFTSRTLRGSPHRRSDNSSLRPFCLCVGLSAGKAYTLTTGSSENRWEKMKDKLNVVADSFIVYGY